MEVAERTLTPASQRPGPLEAGILRLRRSPLIEDHWRIEKPSAQSLTSPWRILPGKSRAAPCDDPRPFGPNAGPRDSGMSDDEEDFGESAPGCRCEGPQPRFENCGDSAPAFAREGATAMRGDRQREVAGGGGDLYVPREVRAERPTSVPNSPWPAPTSQPPWNLQ